jgi:hypothetical protein
MWTQGVEHPQLEPFIAAVMGSYAVDMWSRAGREIERAYATRGAPLQAFSAITPPTPVLHLYAEPSDPWYLAAQQAYSRPKLWFEVIKLTARSHFPMFEVRQEMACILGEFAASTGRGARALHQAVAV